MNTTGKLKIDCIINRTQQQVTHEEVKIKKTQEEKDIEYVNKVCERLGCEFRRDYPLNFKVCVCKYCESKNYRFREYKHRTIRKKFEGRETYRNQNFRIWICDLNLKYNNARFYFIDEKELEDFMLIDGFKKEDYIHDTTK